MSAAAAQAQSSAARRLAHAIRLSINPTRITALLSPLQESRLDLFVGWTTQPNPKWVN